MISAERIARRAVEFEWEDAEMAGAEPARRFAASLAAHLETEVAGAVSRGSGHCDMDFSTLRAGNCVKEEFRDVTMKELIIEVRVLFWEAGMRTEMVNPSVIRVCDLRELSRYPQRRTSNTRKHRASGGYQAQGYTVGDVTIVDEEAPGQEDEVEWSSQVHHNKHRVFYCS